MKTLASNFWKHIYWETGKTWWNIVTVPVGNHDCIHQDEFLTKAPNHHKTVRFSFENFTINKTPHCDNDAVSHSVFGPFSMWIQTTMFSILQHFCSIKNKQKQQLFLPRSSAHPLNPAGGAQSRWPSWPHAARGPPCGQRHQGGCRCCSGCSGCSIPAAARRCSLHITSRAHQLV